MAAFNLTGQGMQRNAEVGLFTKPSRLKLLTMHHISQQFSFLPSYHPIIIFGKNSEILGTATRRATWNISATKKGTMPRNTVLKGTPVTPAMTKQFIMGSWTHTTQRGRY
jgi:hypothetical protein